MFSLFIYGWTTKQLVNQQTVTSTRSVLDWDILKVAAGTRVQDATSQPQQGIGSALTWRRTGQI